MSIMTETNSQEKCAYNYACLQKQPYVSEVRQNKILPGSKFYVTDVYVSINVTIPIRRSWVETPSSSQKTKREATIQTTVFPKQWEEKLHSQFHSPSSPLMIRGAKIANTVDSSAHETFYSFIWMECDELSLDSTPLVRFIPPNIAIFLSYS